LRTALKLFWSIRFNPVRISGVRGLRRPEARAEGGFNPVRISGVRGLLWLLLLACALSFQSGADFWGPGTLEPTRRVRLHR